MKRLSLVLAFFLFTTTLNAGFLDSMSIGFGGGYSSYKTFQAELHLKSKIDIYDKNAELKFGFNNRSYFLEYVGIKKLNASSLGFFGDFTIYPFDEGLFLGIRWEFINFNWLTQESKKDYQDAFNSSAPEVYTGTCAFFQFGYNLKLSDLLSINFYWQPGFQYYKIFRSFFTFGNIPDNDQKISEYRFLYNLNCSIDFLL